jgi:hypothetical protein
MAHACPGSSRAIHGLSLLRLGAAAAAAAAAGAATTAAAAALAGPVPAKAEAVRLGLWRRWPPDGGVGAAAVDMGHRVGAGVPHIPARSKQSWLRVSTARGREAGLKVQPTQSCVAGRASMQEEWCKRTTAFNCAPCMSRQHEYAAAQQHKNGASLCCLEQEQAAATRRTPDHCRARRQT